MSDITSDQQQPFKNVCNRELGKWLIVTVVMYLMTFMYCFALCLLLCVDEVIRMVWEEGEAKLCTMYYMHRLYYCTGILLNAD